MAARRVRVPETDLFCCRLQLFCCRKKNVAVYFENDEKAGYSGRKKKLREIKR